MKKILSVFLFFIFLISNVHSKGYYDTTDPLFRLKGESFLSESLITFSDQTLRLSQNFSYGINNSLSFGIGFAYQQDLDRDSDGLNNIDLGLNYRSGNSRVISDILLGVKLKVNTKVQDMGLSRTVYYGGIKLGRRWKNFSFSTTFKTSWIFEKVQGMAFINITPDMYLRLNNNWKIGAGFDFRKSTSEYYDQGWVNFKIVRQYGRTQYLGIIGYEFEKDESLFGAKINILF